MKFILVMILFLPAVASDKCDNVKFENECFSECLVRPSSMQRDFRCRKMVKQPFGFCDIVVTCDIQTTIPAVVSPFLTTPSTVAARTTITAVSSFLTLSTTLSTTSSTSTGPTTARTAAPSTTLSTSTSSTWVKE